MASQTKSKTLEERVAELEEAVKRIEAARAADNEVLDRLRGVVDKLVGRK